MSDKRRYSESEITLIFKQAAKAQEATRRNLSHSEGLTLAELQHIGQEAGITPAFIARAAATLNQADVPPPPSTYLGLPLSVARTVALPGPLSDEGWDRLVGDLRETFQASGEVWRDGSLRQWRNGNLYAHVEPTDSGHRLRFRTTSATLQSGLIGGLILFAVGLVFMLTLALKGDFMVELDKTFFVSMFAVLGLGSMGVSAYRLPYWAAQRGRQMEAIATRAVERAGTSPAVSPLKSAAPQGLDLGTLEDPVEVAQAPVHRSTRTQTD